MRTVDVLVPVYKPDEKLRKLLFRLQQQTVTVQKIILLHTIEEPKVEIASYIPDGFTVPIEEMSIPLEEFDHGGTRAYGAEKSDAEFMLYMTQDAVPANERLIEELLAPFADVGVGICYARQLPRKEAKAVERLIRGFNYPDTDRIQTASDVETLGIKAYFCSDVCALYRKSAYEAIGGFVKKTIFNEDMIAAADMLAYGYKVIYVAGARVIHSHSYTLRQQFSRNFDLAVSQVQYKRVFEGISSENEGISMVKTICKYLCKHGKLLQIPYFILECAVKFLGFRLGKMYERLPMKIILACTMSKRYWMK